MASTTAPSEAWHYPPELVELTVKAVSLLNKGKEGELDFFRGAQLWLVTSDRGLRARVAPYVDRTIGGGAFVGELEAQ